MAAKPRRREEALLYAVSKDGIHWAKPELGLIEFNGSKKNNIVLEYNHGMAVMKDPHETDPQKRYKAIHPEREHSAVWFSADGIVWGNKHDVGPIDFGGCPSWSQYGSVNPGTRPTGYWA